MYVCRVEKCEYVYVFNWEMNMIKRILVVNCGEIVVRVMCFCWEMEIMSIVVFLEVDWIVKYVFYVDEVYCIGLVVLKESYLNIEKIIEVVKLCYVDVIYLGYGFLLENVIFVCCCWEEGIIFIGFDLEIMEVMGDKILVCIKMIEVGVLVVLGI